MYLFMIIVTFTFHSAKYCVNFQLATSNCILKKVLSAVNFENTFFPHFPLPTG